MRCVACDEPVAMVGAISGGFVVTCAKCASLTLVLAPGRYDRVLRALVSRADLEVLEALEPVTLLAYLVTTPLRAE